MSLLKLRFYQNIEVELNVTERNNYFKLAKRINVNNYTQSQYEKYIWSLKRHTELTFLWSIFPSYRNQPIANQLTGFCMMRTLVVKKLRSYGLLIRALDYKSKSFKGALSGRRQFLATESPLKMMKNVFYFISKALFVFKIFKFFSWLFGHVSKRLD